MQKQKNKIPRWTKSTLIPEIIGSKPSVSNPGELLNNFCRSYYCGFAALLRFDASFSVIRIILLFLSCYANVAQYEAQRLVAIKLFIYQ